MDEPKPKVLVVDDDEAVLDYLAIKMAKHFELVTTSDPRQAVALARMHLPDVILCDIDMPQMGGGELASELELDSLTARIPLVYLTGLVTPEETREMEGRVSGKPAVSKRAPLSELLAVVARVTGRGA